MTSEQEFLAVYDVSEDKSGIEIIVFFTFFVSGKYTPMVRIGACRIPSISNI